MTKKIITFSGPDRVGKTTLINKIASFLREEKKNYKVAHFSAPDHSWADPMEDIYQVIHDSSDKYDILLLDRSWICRVIYGVIRDGGYDLIPSATKIEYMLHRCFIDVIHVGVIRPWHFSAPHHITEIENLYIVSSEAYKLVQLEKARKEHHIYYEILRDYFDNYSLFPNICYFGETTKEINKLYQQLEV